MPSVALPVGISFYTFQTMSYSIDVYRRNCPAQRDPIAFGCYVTMFPQLIAGPIVRYVDVMREINGRRETFEGFFLGIRRFLVGLAKKLILANGVGMLWDSVSAQPAASLSALSAWLGVLAYAFQIYFDFSGYSDMAIGMGPGCSASSFRRTSAIRTSRGPFRTSGGGGTSRCRPGSANTSTSP